MVALQIWRILIFITCLITFCLLLRSSLLNRESWNSKTRNYWYALTMWTVSGMSLSFEGFLRQRPLSVSLAVVTAATLVSFFGTVQRGEWGGSK